MWSCTALGSHRDDAEFGSTHGLSPCERCFSLVQHSSPLSLLPLPLPLLLPLPLPLPPLSTAAGREMCITRHACIPRAVCLASLGMITHYHKTVKFLLFCFSTATQLFHPPSSPPSPPHPSPSLSPTLSSTSLVVSGDADGKLTVWEWRTTRIVARFKAHDSVCISCLWLPHETSKVISCGWDGKIHLWD